MKLSFRTRTSYSITQVGEPSTLNSEDFVKAVPPYKGETEEDFQELKQWVNDTAFDRLGVFTYSHEENTHAHLLEDDVS